MDVLTPEALDQPSIKPNFEGFARAILEAWPTGDVEGAYLFDCALQYGMIQEVPGGYDPEQHIDADGICPEPGDPWYEYTFGGKDGPGQFSLAEMRSEIDALRAKRDAALDLMKSVASASGLVRMQISNIEHAASLLERETWAHLLVQNLRSSVRYLKTAADTLDAMPSGESRVKPLLQALLQIAEEPQFMAQIQTLLEDRIHTARKAIAEFERSR